MVTVKSALLQVNRSLAEFILTQQGACDKQLVRHKDQLESWNSRVESSRATTLFPGFAYLPYFTSQAGTLLV